MPVTPPGAPGPRERVAIIRDLMIRLEWVKGETGPALAREWGLEVNTVEVSAAEASRSLTPAGEPVEGGRDYLITRLREAINAASCEADWKALAPLLEVARKVLGVASPDASGLTVNVLVDARGSLRPDARAFLEGACRAAARLGVDPVAFRRELAGELAQQVPGEAVLALALPPAMPEQERARVLVEALAEAWPGGDEAAELVPVLQAMVEGEDD